MTKTKKLLIAAGALAGMCAVGFVAARIAVEAYSPTPTNLGVANGELAPCPPTPNCVTSRATDAEHAIDPIIYSDSTAEAHQRLVEVLQSMPRLTIVENQPNYIRAESRTAFWGFIDDNEFYFDDNSRVIEVRAAARLGQGDLGNNRARIEEIRSQFQVAAP